MSQSVSCCCRGTRAKRVVRRRMCHRQRSTVLPRLIPLLPTVHHRHRYCSHEFGHVTHCLCSTTRLNRFASFRCEMDFVEAPSQMLENWCWEPATLQMLSGHHADHSKKLPMELALKLKNSQLAHAGLTNMRQVFLATFDQRLHQMPAKAPTADSLTRRSAPEVAADELIKTLHDEVLKIKHTPGTSFGASFGHLVGGYRCVRAAAAAAAARLLLAATCGVVAIALNPTPVMLIACLQLQLLRLPVE